LLQAEFLREAEVTAAFKHQNIVKFWGLDVSAQVRGIGGRMCRQAVFEPALARRVIYLMFFNSCDPIYSRGFWLLSLSPTAICGAF
jgi:hypothetical protein